MIIPGMFSSGNFGIIPDPPEETECLGYWEDPDKFSKDDCKFCLNYDDCLKEYESEKEYG